MVEGRGTRSIYLSIVYDIYVDGRTGTALYLPIDLEDTYI